MRNSIPRIDVLLVQRSDVRFYPPTINQMNLLLESGLRVALLDGSVCEERLGALNSNIVRVSPENKSGIKSNIEFVRLFLELLRNSSVRVCVAYDSPASSLLGVLPFSGVRAFHFHEYPGADGWGREPFLYKIYNKVAIHYSKRVKQVTFADSHRASSFYREHNLQELPTVIRNCPRKQITLQKGVMKSRLRQMGLEFSRILMFQGAVSTNYYADTIVKSMRFWPDDAIMVFVGPVDKDLENILLKLANTIGAESRLVFLGQIPYAELFSYTIDADIVFTMIKPVTFDFMHMAGASNKRYEAMACGIPQISNYGPGMRELVEDNGVGVCVDAENSTSIGEAVCLLLENSVMREEMSVAARNLHLTRLNYEREFAPLLARIEQWCREGNDA